MEPAPNQYQARYTAHQQRKKGTLMKIMKDRHSERMFDSAPIPHNTLERWQHEITAVKAEAPSSCDRQAVSLFGVTGRDDRAFLGGVLVGGVGWIHRAPLVVLVFADPVAYVAGDEIKWMPYLDAGVVIQQVLLWATAEGLHSAFANPNIRDGHRPFFESQFGNQIFCGAIALGYPPEDA